ncbi:hypothetical protein SAMN02745227_01713 [Anaerobranca californiensis DSM 14826]|uniref:Uncharacterized protein n=1 Tax=Anaerobranca californiensis DSM 14826 TaxID=1120989 RepID=A0A1M6QBZ2_9FIRM|nr:hypothetical protein SAMN02745227_01713 [Anaerobranca californiensis DSM 14826]
MIFPLTITGISTIYFLIRAQKYDGNIYDEKGKLRKGAWKEFIIPLIITGIALGFVIILIFISSQPTKITFTDEGFKIHGLYGEKISWESIPFIYLQRSGKDIILNFNIK